MSIGTVHNVINCSVAFHTLQTSHRLHATMACLEVFHSCCLSEISVGWLNEHGFILIYFLQNSSENVSYDPSEACQILLPLAIVACLFFLLGSQPYVGQWPGCLESVFALLGASLYRELLLRLLHSW